MIDDTLEVSVVGNYFPEAGDALLLERAGDENAGSFATELLPTLGGGLWFDVVKGTSEVTLLVQGVEGEFNLDGSVDAADSTVRRDSVGQTGSSLAADNNHNGVVDSSDFET